MRETIDSPLNQTYSKTELIVVDDGYTDNSREIIESYNNKVISPLYKENGEPASRISKKVSEKLT